MLNDSSRYWKSTIDNIASCNCDRENIEEEREEREEREEDIIDKIDYHTDYPIVKDDGTYY
jgi:hypothetical protein